MANKNKIINIAVIAHVDAGKSTLVDAFLHQSGTFRDNEVVKDCVMDSNDLEAERGITIYSKNCSINYKDYKINIVDTPGHSDFSSEVERVIKTVDTVILLVDASEGPMPQTRFVLQKSLEAGLRPILFINKIDKQDQRAEEVVDEVFDLFVDLNATDEQCEFPIIYGIAKQGIAKKEMEDESTNLAPLFETVVEHVDAYPDYSDEPLQLQVSALAYDDYVGRLGIGRIYKGTVKNGETVSICKADGSVARGRITKLTVYEGLNQVEKQEAYAGDIVVIAGIADISIGETICEANNPLPMELIHIEEPTLSMNFLVNDSPFCGKSGKFVTTRHLKDRLDKELEVNVGLKVEPMDTTDGYRVSGRGELHLSILLENMRREGYEIGVSGRLGIGRIYKGTVKNGETVSICKADGSVARGRITKLTVYEGLNQVEKQEAYAGDIVVIAGIADISIGETICEANNPLPMELIHIEEPTLSMNFLVNDSPFCGKSGKFVTTRHLKDRLDKELEVNVGLKVEPMDTTDGYRVSGRGELHLSILLENMRREGYEIGVSKPEVLFIKDENGKLMEPMERVIVNCPEVYSGTVINKLNLRKAMMEAMEIEGDYVKITFIAPTRGLLGYRSEFINDTRGEGSLVRSFERYEEHKGEMPGRTNGVLIAQTAGTTMAYSLNALSERAQMFVEPAVEVYEGMIIGMNSRKDDMVVNPCKNKKLTNVRASGTDDAVKLQAARTFTLEEALEFIDDDELVEITPDSIRLRKKFLNENERLRYNKSRQGK